MSAPTWLATISPHAMINRTELLEWLGISVAELREGIKGGTLPPPRLVSATNPSQRLTNRSRWRVGDVRAYLSRDINRRELARNTPMCCEARSPGKTLPDLSMTPYREKPHDH